MTVPPVAVLAHAVDVVRHVDVLRAPVDALDRLEDLGRVAQRAVRQRAQLLFERAVQLVVAPPDLLQVLQPPVDRVVDRHLHVVDL